MKKLSSYLSEHEMSLDEMAEGSGIEKDRLKSLMDGEKPKGDELKKLAKCLDCKLDEMESMSEHEHGEKDDEEEKPEPKDDDEKDEPKGEELELLSLVGAGNRSQALGIIRGLKAKADLVDTLSVRLEKLEGASRKSEIGALVAQGQAEGKLPTKPEHPLTRWAHSLGEKDVEQLRGFLSAAPKRFAVQSLSGSSVEPSARAVSSDSKSILGALGFDASDPKVAEARGKSLERLSSMSADPARMTSDGHA